MSHKIPEKATAVIVLNDGSLYWGYGIGAKTKKIGEICFNTSMTGYQEILTDPSYAAQIITFTFPHIGNVGTNDDDLEAKAPAARGLIIRENITNPSNWRSTEHLNAFLEKHTLPGICGVDTRALTRRIRDKGAPNGVICHFGEEKPDIDTLIKDAEDWAGLNGMDLAPEVTCKAPYEWTKESNAKVPHIVAMDFGAKQNILRCLAGAGCKVTVVPANTSFNDINAYKPDGVFLSNGPGDPAATGEYAIPTIKALLDKNIPIFGICLGHQLLALSLGGKTRKMHLGHRGANHPVKDLQTGKVEITSQNHGFCVLPDTLPDNVEVTHTSLFDGSNEGIRAKDKKAFSVQYHPEASPGPHDSHYLFDRFIKMVKDAG